jgi:hypothetical protein
MVEGASESISAGRAGTSNTELGVDIPADLREKILQDLRYLKTLDVTTTLQAEIIAHLLYGRRTPRELVELIFEIENDCGSFHQYYMRISRALQSLESHGFVSRRLFGSEKPYRLTRYALSRLASLDRDRGRGPVSRWDASIIATTVGVGIATIAADQGLVPLARLEFMVLYTLFILLSGMSLLRFIEMVRRVW